MIQAGTRLATAIQPFINYLYLCAFGYNDWTPTGSTLAQSYAAHRSASEIVRYYQFAHHTKVELLNNHRFVSHWRDAVCQEYQWLCVEGLEFCEVVLSYLLDG